jgi:hypothetical protein
MPTIKCPDCYGLGQKVEMRPLTDMKRGWPKVPFGSKLLRKAELPAGGRDAQCSGCYFDDDHC